MKIKRFLLPLGIVAVVLCGSMIILPQILSGVVLEQLLKSADIRIAHAGQKSCTLTQITFSEVTLVVHDVVTITADTLILSYVPFQIFLPSYEVTLTATGIRYEKTVGEQDMRSSLLEGMVLDRLCIPMTLSSRRTLSIQDGTIESSVCSGTVMLEMDKERDTLSGDISCVMRMQDGKGLPLPVGLSKENFPEEYPVRIRLTGSYKMPSIEVTSPQFTLMLKGNENHS